MNTGKLELITTFMRVVETGSFTAVATESGTTQPTISRQISALEQHLNARLLQRTTRALTLTDEGRAYYAQCESIMEAVNLADACVRPDVEQVSGTLRIAASLAFGRLHVLPRLSRFFDRWPAIRVELVLGDENTNLVEERIDVALRIGAIVDESLVARRIGETRRVAVASPNYLTGRSRPVCPSDLEAHDCIIVTSQSAPTEWTFRATDNAGKSEQTIDVSVSGPVSVNASGAVHEAVLAGFGVALTPTWQWRDEFDRGQIVRLLERFEPPPMPIHAVYPTRRHVTPRVRAFIDFIAGEFARDPVLAGRGVASAAAIAVPSRQR